MIIENLEITKMYYTMRREGDKKDIETAYKLIKWQSSKPSVNGTIEETNPEIISRYIALRDKWIGGPIFLVYKDDCEKIDHRFTEAIGDCFLTKQYEAGHKLLDEWAKGTEEWGTGWRPWYKANANKFISGKMCQIVDKGVYNMVQHYKTKFLGGTENGED